METLYLARWVTAQPREVGGHSLLQNAEPFGPSGYGHWWQAWFTAMAVLKPSLYLQIPGPTIAPKPAPVAMTATSMPWSGSYT